MHTAACPPSCAPLRVMARHAAIAQVVAAVGGGGRVGIGIWGCAAPGAWRPAAATTAVCAAAVCASCACRRLKPLAFLRTLAFQLAVRVPALRPYYLGASFAGLAASDDGAGQAFDQLLQQPLSQHQVSAQLCGRDGTCPNPGLLRVNCMGGS
jgi:hypothetical protein